jgi:hypothetical protein
MGVLGVEKDKDIADIYPLKLRQNFREALRKMKFSLKEEHAFSRKEAAFYSSIRRIKF